MAAMPNLIAMVMVAPPPDRAAMYKVAADSTAKLMRRAAVANNGALPASTKARAASSAGPFATWNPNRPVQFADQTEAANDPATPTMLTACAPLAYIEI